MRTTDRRLTIVLAASLSAVVFTAPAAFAQTAKPPTGLQTLHDRLCKPDVILATVDGNKALDQLKLWNLDIGSFSPADRAMALRVEVYAALAAGQASLAGDRVGELMAENADRRDALAAAYLVAAARGDAKAAIESLEKLAKDATRDEKPRISRRQRWSTKVGELGPKVEISTDDGAAFNLRELGDRVLLLDFWNMASPPTLEHVKALRALHAALAPGGRFELIGINADSPSRTEKAREFVSNNGIDWKQVFEQRSTKAPLTHEAFNAGTPPWCVLIDRYGYVRAVGDPTEPGLVYAARAAVNEAGGDAPEVLTVDKSGKRADPKQIRVAKREKVIEEERAARQQREEGRKELPSNAEARSKLDQARLFMKTGKKTDARRLLQEIVSQYAGTREAREAQEILDSMP
jgi:FimV-like protein